jgi:hypothetical protein
VTNAAFVAGGNLLGSRCGSRDDLSPAKPGRGRWP